MNEKTEKSFIYQPSLEAIRYFKNASAESKLNWLEDAAQFVKDFVPREKLQKWSRLSRR
jgi:hypothetical protein